MPLLKKRQKRNPEIPTASMADIAFLLLIFFLVTTTINADKGIYMQLPPKLEDTEPPEIRQRNLLNILVNSDGTVLLDNEVTNNGQDPDLSESPDKAVVSFKTKRGLPYETYIEVLDEIKSAYNEIYDSEARAVAGVDYGVYRARLGEEDVDQVKEKFPVKISLAEPDPGE